MRNITVSYADLKALIAKKGLMMQYEEKADRYRVFLVESGTTYSAFLFKSPITLGGLDESAEAANVSDFETNYKATANKPIVQLDSDGASMSRSKVAPSGWNFQFRGIEFTTSTLNSVVNKDASNSDLTDATLKLYNASDVLITASEDQGTCVKTILDIEPPYDIYVAGGKLRMLTASAEDIRMSVIGVPDVPANLGGSKPFVQNINLKYIPVTEGVNADGRAAKWLQYSATYHTNKLRFIFHHSAGYALPLSVFIEVYKQ